MCGQKEDDFLQLISYVLTDALKLFLSLVMKCSQQGADNVSAQLCFFFCFFFYYWSSHLFFNWSSPVRDSSWMDFTALSTNIPDASQIKSDAAVGACDRPERSISVHDKLSFTSLTGPEFINWQSYSLLQISMQVTESQWVKQLISIQNHIKEQISGMKCL